MTERQPQATTSDLEYDLAHEAVGSERGFRHEDEAHAVPVMPVDDGGDYSYDLAHDVPGR
jgi:hypothetical protein